MWGAERSSTTPQTFPVHRAGLGPEPGTQSTWAAGIQPLQLHLLLPREYISRARTQAGHHNYQATCRPQPAYYCGTQLPYLKERLNHCHLLCLSTHLANIRNGTCTNIMETLRIPLAGQGSDGGRNGASACKGDASSPVSPLCLVPTDPTHPAISSTSDTGEETEERGIYKR